MANKWSLQPPARGQGIWCGDCTVCILFCRTSQQNHLSTICRCLMMPENVRSHDLMALTCASSLRSETCHSCASCISVKQNVGRARWKTSLSLLSNNAEKRCKDRLREIPAPIYVSRQCKDTSRGMENVRGNHPSERARPVEGMYWPSSTLLQTPLVRLHLVIWSPVMNPLQVPFLMRRAQIFA